jgi:HD superfamily phosphodiesterase
MVPQAWVPAPLIQLCQTGWFLGVHRMLTNLQFNEIAEFTHKYLEESAAKSEQPFIKKFPRSAEHRWQHTLNVLRNAEKILAGDGFSQDVASAVRAACLLHDVSMFVCDHEVHGQVSAKIAEGYLSEKGYSVDFIGRVARAIAEHGVDFDTLTPEAMGAAFSQEGKLLIEADILDKLGACAITDSLLAFGKDDRLQFECRLGLQKGRAMERAAYFKEYLWSQTGKRMASDRIGFFLKFLEQMQEEIVETSSPA